MSILSISNLGLSYGDHRVLAGVNMTLAAGDHVGMVGRNGCGKTTLLKLIAGLDGLRPDTGQIQVARDTSVGYLRQDPDLNPNHTLRQEAATALAQLDHLQSQLDATAEEMGSAEDGALERLLKRYEKLEHDMEMAGGYAVDHQIDATLHGLGLEDGAFETRVGDLSGGQQGRLALAKLLLSQPDILLLDEPTNHLDIDGRVWLEQFLAAYRGTAVLVSHDRWLLDRVVSRIYEVENGAMFEYPGNYVAYLEQRALRKTVEQRVYEKQQDNIRHQQSFIDRYRTGQRAKQARGREKRLERYIDQELIDKPFEEATIHLEIRPKARSGDLVITAERLGKGYGTLRLFDDLDLVIKRGDRIGIIGPNGAGKTTLVRCLIGDLSPDAGAARLGSQVDIGHYRQTHDHLDRSLTVVDYLRRFVPDGSEQSARGLAGAFLFRELEQDKPLGTLSGGERSRAVLAGLIVSGHNLLILDEPTNHLDVQSAEQLERALLEFCGTQRRAADGAQGTLILITHDRMLLDHVVDQLLVVDGHGRVQHFLGTYSDYLTAAAAPAPTAEPEAPLRREPPPKPAAKRAARSARTGGAMTKLSQKALEQKIMELESAIADVDRQLADPDVYRDGAKMQALGERRETCVTELAPLEEEWARRAEED
ncbi:MAG: ABC transporter [Phycisphaeraceae bacterium]|nr:ABC transporter [Phycisphaeraceae bacterium]